MRRYLLLTTIVASILSAQNAPEKRRVAVLNFDYGTVYSGVSGIFGTNVDVGKGIADILVDRLVQSGTYSVIERKALEKVMAEQNFSNSNRADASSAAKLGKVLGVDAIIIGSVTQFGRDDRTTGVSGLGGITGRYGIGQVGKKEAKAVVEITARMIHVDTAEILVSAQGKGESTRTGTTLVGSGGTAINSGGGAVDMSSRNFASTILGEAVNKAVTNVATELNQNVVRVPTRTVPVDGLVADVNGTTLILNVGTKNGIRVGDKLEVASTGREIRDPATGKVIRRTDTVLGSITITEVDETSSVGTYSGADGVKVGDHVKR
jgi:curli biogenesis system outer membrane secretion channel CsgG